MKKFVKTICFSAILAVCVCAFPACDSTETRTTVTEEEWEQAFSLQETNCTITLKEYVFSLKENQLVMYSKLKNYKRETGELKSTTTTLVFNASNEVESVNSYECYTVLENQIYQHYTRKDNTSAWEKAEQHGCTTDSLYAYAVYFPAFSYDETDKSYHAKMPAFGSKAEFTAQFANGKLLYFIISAPSDFKSEYAFGDYGTTAYTVPEFNLK